MSLMRRYLASRRSLEAGPARPPTGATGLPHRPLVAPCHTPDHATCLSRRPAASLARHASHTRHQSVMPPARLWCLMPKPLVSCYACERTGALVTSPDAPLNRSCMLSRLLAASDGTKEEEWIILCSNVV
jgi:hypothetical protein